MLVLFCFSTLMNGAGWISFAPITDTLKHVIYIIFDTIIRVMMLVCIQ